MGGRMCLPRYGWCIKQHNPDPCKENHARTPHHRRNMSATFNISSLASPGAANGCLIPTPDSDLININTASEEELMTVPGINRKTAHNIVEYCEKLGGFKKVEDLALVSGVGATKLSQIRSELTVGTKKKSSGTNSAHSSHIDLSIMDNSSRSLNKLGGTVYNMVVVNDSNVFHLMKVPGISQTLAENIVAHRESKGLFKRIDDLVKVRGIKAPFLSAIRPYLLLNHEDGDHTKPEVQIQSNEQCLSNDGINIECCRLDGRLDASQENLIANYGPLSKRSFRTKKKPVVERRSKQRSLRFASWLLDSCSKSKAENPGVKEVVAMTILENGLDIVAVQHVLDTEALPKLCQELNAPTISNVRKWSGYHGNWKSVTRSLDENSSHGVTYLGCLYDSSHGLEVVNCSYIPSVTEGSTHALLVHFTMDGRKLAVVNVYCDKSNTAVPDLPSLLQYVHGTVPEECDIVIAGHFNNNSECDVFASWHEAGYHNILAPDINTDISPSSQDGTACLDNIWFSQRLAGKGQFAFGVVREGLANPWIPDGWQWGGLVSRHCPVWADIPESRDTLI